MALTTVQGGHIYPARPHAVLPWESLKLAGLQPKPVLDPILARGVGMLAAPVHVDLSSRSASIHLEDPG